MERRALLLGSTGLVGSRCLSHLLERRAHGSITCIVRRPVRADGPGGQRGEAVDRVREQVVDFDALAPGDIDPVDDVLCAIGTTMKKAGSREAFRRVDFDIPLRVIDLAVKAGATRVALVSSVGASPGASSFYLRTKGELEEAIAALPLRAYHVLRPSLLLGDRDESRLGEAMGAAIFRVAGGLLAGGLRKYRPIDADAVGAALVTAITREDPEHVRRNYEHDEILGLAR